MRVQTPGQRWGVPTNDIGALAHRLFDRHLFGVNALERLEEKQVALADQPDQAVAIQHWQVPDSMGPHQSVGIGQTPIDTDRVGSWNCVVGHGGLSHAP